VLYLTNKDISTIKERILHAVEIEKLYLFGSYAYGEPNENSDYDFYMVIPNNSMRPIDATIKAQSALWGLNLKGVDIIAGTVDGFEKRCFSPTLERKIVQEGKLLYER